MERGLERGSDHLPRGGALVWEPGFYLVQVRPEVLPDQLPMLSSVCVGVRDHDQQ